MVGVEFFRISVLVVGIKVLFVFFFKFVEKVLVIVVGIDDCCAAPFYEISQVVRGRVDANWIIECVDLRQYRIIAGGA